MMHIVKILMKTIGYSIGGCIFVIFASGLHGCAGASRANGERIARDVTPEELYQYLPEATRWVPPEATDLEYYDRQARGGFSSGTRDVLFRLPQDAFERAVAEQTNLAPITEPTTFKLKGHPVENGWIYEARRERSTVIDAYDSDRCLVWMFSRLD